MQDTILENAGTEVVATAAQPESEEEQKLTEEIRGLWAEHANAQATVKKSKAEIKAIRERLSERLCQMKQLLVKPGRKGGWSSFLRSEGIAKATADRLVRNYQRSTGQEPNVVTEEVSEPGEGDIKSPFSSLLPRLKQKLPTPQWAYRFLLRFVSHFNLAHEMHDTGILVLEPPSEETSSAAAPTAVGQAVAVANATIGDVL